MKAEARKLHSEMPSHLKTILIVEGVLMDLNCPDVAVKEMRLPQASANKVGVLNQAHSKRRLELDDTAVGLNSAVVSWLKGHDWAEIDVRKRWRKLSRKFPKVDRARAST